MNYGWKRLLKRIVPRSWLQWWRRRHTLHFTGPYDEWATAKQASRGYDAPDILARVASATRRVVRGEVAYERDSITFHDPAADPCLLPELQRLVPAAAGASIVILDFGGSLGSSYHQHRKFLPATCVVRWHVIEQPHYAQLGAREFQTNELLFHSDFAGARSEIGTPTLILLSSVLQYLESPWVVLEQLAALKSAALLVTRTPFSDEKDDRIVVQNVPPSIYSASYPSWVFSRGSFQRFWTDRQAHVEWRTSPEGEMAAGRFRFHYRTVVIRPHVL